MGSLLRHPVGPRIAARTTFDAETVIAVRWTTR